MKIYEDTNQDFGEVFKKISEALKRYAPSDIEWVGSHEEADLTIIQVVGGEEFEKLERMDLKKTIIYQHCLLTTGIDNQRWLPLWKECKALVSWNNLEQATGFDLDYIRIPLGGYPEKINVVPKLNKSIDIFTTGHVARSENIDIIYEACKESGKVMHHTGHNFRYSPNWYKYLPFMQDNAFYDTLSKSKYVAGLREIEGFEHMCLEAAMAGSVPIVPNLPSYDFYKDFAIMLDLDENLKDNLVNVLSSNYEELSSDKVAFVRENFSWEKVMNKFYKEIL